MFNDTATNNENIVRQVRRLKARYIRLVNYLFLMVFLTMVNFLVSPDYWWVVWPAIGLGLGLVLQTLRAFDLTGRFFDDWEEKQIRKRLAKTDCR